MIGPGIQTNIPKHELLLYRLSLPSRLSRRAAVREDRAACARKGRR